MATVLVDTGVWFTIFDPREQRKYGHEAVDDLLKRIMPHTIVVLWPIAYETLGSQFVKNSVALEAFEKALKAPNIAWIDDAPYRDQAMALAFETSLRRKRPLSMVDCTMRLFMDDESTRVQFLATHNIRDFADVCRKREIEIMV